MEDDRSLARVYWLRSRIEAILVEVEGMKAENERCRSRRWSPAYGDIAFFEKAGAVNALSSSLYDIFQGR